jgi:transcription initiation factor TFIIF subunit alpha
MDEELDYDVNEDFQDDEDVNTFYRDENEDEDAKLHEVGSCRGLV